ncbi:MAG: hypothetical protein NW200_08550 [Hyphomonadaceae bacterium]|nr:hypothetical protein [Hyphomonadaceae bacterium]
MRLVRAVAALAALAALAGCGFKPMYAAGGNGALGPIAITEVKSKMGHALRTELARLLSNGGDGPTRRLEIEVVESVAGLGLRVDESSSRADLIAEAKYVLYDPAGQPLIRNSVVAVVTYDIPGPAYSAAAGQDDARERAGVMLAQRLRNDLIFRLERARRAPPQTQEPKAETAPAGPPAEPLGVPAARDTPGGLPQTVQPPQS